MLLILIFVSWSAWVLFKILNGEFEPLDQRLPGLYAPTLGSISFSRSVSVASRQCHLLELR